MNPTKYIKSNNNLQELSRAKELVGSRALLNVIEKKRDEERSDVEHRPVRTSDLRDDVYYKLGFVAGLNWVLEFPGVCHEYLQRLPEGE